MIARLHVSLSQSRLRTALHADILVTDQVFIHGGSPLLPEEHALFVEQSSHPALAVCVPPQNLVAVAVSIIKLVFYTEL